ncbi:uncharacterized protein LOC117332599 isoform X2 [Pecten maximus]|uniref:uncharacterized protein LOC117332599 isoform X2 n=1 Tax=Pecten maximus TaxID=6579 RepID=UPI00145857CC|nr:uncharacterized protein LOC117332599 isoform X2 [Pecten maximus]
MDKTNQFDKTQVQSDRRVPACLYPEVVVIAHGSVSSISVSSDLRRPPTSGGYWACSECSLVEGVHSYQIPTCSPSRKVSLKNRILNRITSILFSCIKKKQTNVWRTQSAASVRSVCVDSRSGDVSVRSLHPAIQRLRMRHQDMYAIFNEDLFY